MKSGYFRLVSRCDRPPFGYIARKRSLKFRFPEADIHHRVLTTQSGSWLFVKADVQSLNSPALRGFIRKVLWNDELGFPALVKEEVDCFRPEAVEMKS